MKNLKNWGKLIAVIGGISTILTIPYWLNLFFGIDFFYTNYLIKVGETFNPKGYTYYEPIKDNNITEFTAYYLNKVVGSRTNPDDDSFKALVAGDILKANQEVRLHSEAKKQSRTTTTIKDGECVIVLDPQKSVPVLGKNPEALPGGYIYVATIPCPNSSPK